MFKNEIEMLENAKYRLDELSEWERRFIKSLSECSHNYELTTPQLKSLRDIHIKLHGGQKWGKIVPVGRKH